MQIKQPKNTIRKAAAIRTDGTEIIPSRKTDSALQKDNEAQMARIQPSKDNASRTNPLNKLIRADMPIITKTT